MKQMTLADGFQEGQKATNIEKREGFLREKPVNKLIELDKNTKKTNRNIILNNQNSFYLETKKTFEVRS